MRSSDHVGLTYTHTCKKAANMFIGPCGCCLRDKRCSNRRSITLNHLQKLSDWGEPGTDGMEYQLTKIASHVVIISSF